MEFNIEDYYEIEEWNDMTKYECTECPYSTLNYEDIIEHIEDNHKPKPKREPVTQEIYDRYGNLIEEKEV